MSRLGYGDLCFANLEPLSLCLPIFSHSPCADCNLPAPLCLVNVFLLFRSVTSWKTFVCCPWSRGLGATQHPVFLASKQLLYSVTTVCLLAHSTLSPRTVEARSDCSQLYLWCLPWCTAQSGQHKNVFAKASCAHCTELGKKQMKLGWKKIITLQTSKLIYECKELGMMKTSLKIQKENMSILPRVSHWLSVSPIITLTFPSVVHCNEDTVSLLGEKPRSRAAEIVQGLNPGTMIHESCGLKQGTQPLVVSARSSGEWNETLHH